MQPAGSPSPGEPAFLVIGKLRRPHGVRGEMQMDVYTDFPERLRPGVTVFVGENRQAERVRSVRVHEPGLLIAFTGYSTSVEVGLFRNVLVYVRADDRPALPEGEYYYHQLIGLPVISDEGKPLGELTQILATGANDVYVVKNESGVEILLPAIESVIQEVDLQQGKIVVHLLPGLVAE